MNTFQKGMLVLTAIVVFGILLSGCGKAESVNGKDVSGGKAESFWFTKAADQGHANAQLELGRMYALGRGVPQDDRKAVELYTKAVDQGDADAQFNLGLMYMFGRGVTQDDRKAADLEKIYSEVNQDIEKLATDAYVSGLDALEKEMIAAAQAREVVSVRNEKERFRRDGDITIGLAGQSPPIVELTAKVLATRDERQNALTAAYNSSLQERAMALAEQDRIKRAADISRLQAEVRDLIGQDRIEDALAVEERIKELRGSVPPGFRPAADAVAEPYTKTGWAQAIVHEATGIEMVYIPAGEFTMGSPSNEAERFSDERQHRVALSRGFYLGKYEVTQGQWEAVMANNPSHFKNVGKTAPVEQVSWEDCQAFCRKLGAGFRLPTEAEWEYAARAGTTTAFHYGNSLDASMANFNGNFPYGGGRKGEWRKTTVPVGSFRPNAWGLYDMHGNVWEWCQDWCQDWYGAYPSGAVTDPTGPASGSSRVRRGGSWSYSARSCRSARRSGSTPGYRFSNLGLRLLFSPSQAGP